MVSSVSSNTGRLCVGMRSGGRMYTDREVSQNPRSSCQRRSGLWDSVTPLTCGGTSGGCRIAGRHTTKDASCFASSKNYFCFQSQDQHIGESSNSQRPQSPMVARMPSPQTNPQTLNRTRIHPHKPILKLTRFGVYARKQLCKLIRTSQAPSTSWTCPKSYCSPSEHTFPHIHSTHTP
ncbi:hypothetical protein KIL84_022816 [Mauremys mutica]|uniref:Uncharacterized protein n=1 Tax=Mauremys mutica TaxID=74926 RepID=A0A9D3WQF1_9SAUR|nr:hypothetical protein KIL84_022816 [Mauremys mutica]